MNGPGSGKVALQIIRGFRLRFLSRLAINFTAGVAVLYLILYLALARALPEEYAGAYHALRGLPGFLGSIIATSVAAYILLACASTAALCVVWLHKVAGPLYRLERVMDGFRSGEPTRPVFFRHGDRFGSLPEAFNAWIGSLRQDRQRCLARMDEAERLCLQDEATCRAEMEKALGQVAEILARYR